MNLKEILNKCRVSFSVYFEGMTRRDFLNIKVGFNKWRQFVVWIKNRDDMRCLSNYTPVVTDREMFITNHIFDRIQAIQSNRRKRQRTMC